jgi:hypothetical protein
LNIRVARLLLSTLYFPGAKSMTAIPWSLLETEYLFCPDEILISASFTGFKVASLTSKETFKLRSCEGIIIAVKRKRKVKN